MKIWEKQKKNLFFLQINVFKEDSTTSLGEFKFESTFKFVTHYSQLPKMKEHKRAPKTTQKTVQKTIQKKEAQTKPTKNAKITETPKVEVKRIVLVNRRRSTRKQNVTAELKDSKDSKDIPDSNEKIEKNPNQSTTPSNKMPIPIIQEIDFSNLEQAVQEMNESNILEYQSDESQLCFCEKILCDCNELHPTSDFEFQYQEEN